MNFEFLFKSENWYFNFENYYFNFFLKLEFETLYLNLNVVISIFKNIIWISNFWFKNWYLNFKLISSNPKISISIQKFINWL
jgi:hypothetical protein